MLKLNPSFLWHIIVGKLKIDNEQELIRANASIRHFPNNLLHFRRINQGSSAFICSIALKEIISQTGPEVIKLFPCSAQLSTKFKMPISIKISRTSAFFEAQISL